MSNPDIRTGTLASAALDSSRVGELGARPWYHTRGRWTP